MNGQTIIFFYFDKMICRSAIIPRQSQSNIKGNEWTTIVQYFSYSKKISKKKKEIFNHSRLTNTFTLTNIQLFKEHKKKSINNIPTKFKNHD